MLFRSLLELFGWYVGSHTQINTLNFTPEQVDQVVNGFKLALNNQKPQLDTDKLGPAVHTYLDKRQKEITTQLKVENGKMAADYFAKLKLDPNVVFTGSGLAYEVIAPGTGATPTAKDTVRVSYVGKLLNETVFDSSLKRGPMEFSLGRVIPGWTEGLQKVAVGGKIRLHVPASLAYGDVGRPGIPPASTLVFDIELLDVKPPVSAPTPVVQQVPVPPPTH